ncbi:hypothetical protein Y032_0559g3442 [Ancylostoma ceylanicum]|uniref:Transmembrane protein 254 n=1 Tax=Ancylostoma ceylanicum TaxID=53326 RepID=A0A016WPE7_9BILA|nr:hypothetical protein Y032_0559g3442 [Ancylostoma ceylanicum]
MLYFNSILFFSRFPPQNIFTSLQLAYYSPLSLTVLPIVGPVAAHIGTHYHWITIITNIFALVAHIGEGLYAIYLCRAMKFSMLCSLKWFVQTFALGFPSLSILVKVARKRTK